MLHKPWSQHEIFSHPLPMTMQMCFLRCCCHHSRSVSIDWIIVLITSAGETTRKRCREFVAVFNYIDFFFIICLLSSTSSSTPRSNFFCERDKISSKNWDTLDECELKETETHTFFHIFSHKNCVPNGAQKEEEMERWNIKKNFTEKLRQGVNESINMHYWCNKVKCTIIYASGACKIRNDVDVRGSRRRQTFLFFLSFHSLAGRVVDVLLYFFVEKGPGEVFSPKMKRCAGELSIFLMNFWACLQMAFHHF